VGVTLGLIIAFFFHSNMEPTASASERNSGEDHVRSELSTRIIGLWPYLFIAISILGWTYELLSHAR
jgi:hypothetical protein